MAKVTNAFDTYTATADREELSDVIYNISPTATPFMSAIGRTNVNNVQFDWQTESLPTASGTGKLEGFELSRSASTATVRESNICQISSRDATVTGTQNASDAAGKRSEMAHQLALMAKVLKKDMEVALTGNTAKNAGNATTVRQTGGFETWIETNVSRGTNGAGNGNGAAPTDGTQRTFTEAMIKSVQQSAFTNGGEPSMLIVGPHVKSVVSGFSGRSTARQMIDANTIEASVSIYSGDFGELQVVPTNVSRARTAMLVDPDFAKVAYLRDFNTTDISTIGDAETKMLLVEYGLEMSNEKAHGLVADLSTS